MVLYLLVERIANIVALFGTASVSRILYDVGEFVIM